jgi:hypothetical protein
VHFLQFTNCTPTKCTIFSLYSLYSSTPTHVSAFNETRLNVIADKNIGCEANAVYEPPEDGLVKAETCVGVKE